MLSFILPLILIGTYIVVNVAVLSRRCGCFLVRPAISMLLLREVAAWSGRSVGRSVAHAGKELDIIDDHGQSCTGGYNAIHARGNHNVCVKS